jgi:hypothetical protein
MTTKAVVNKNIRRKRMSSKLALEAFIDEWTETEARNKKAFLEFKDFLSGQEGVALDFVPREGVTYSLRAAYCDQQDRPLFVMVDVIEDQPRWLSVCFYGEMVTDPEEKGDFVPEGLLGEDAVCFDVEAYDGAFQDYIKQRMGEALEHAAGSPETSP